jgi:predicted  nucleic acid-binding Zn-ribbon protein
MKHLALLLLITASLPLQAAPPKLLASNVEQEATRVQEQIRQIQAQQTTRAGKNQQKRALLNRQVALSQVQIEIKALLQQLDAVKRAEAQTGDKMSSAGDRQSIMDNLQKQVDAYNSMRSATQLDP